VEILKRYGKTIQGVEATDAVIRQSVSVSNAARSMPEEIERLPSVRSSLSIYEQAQSLARLKNRKKVKQDDVEQSARRVLRGRLVVSSESRYYEQQDLLIEKIIDEAKKK